MSVDAAELSEALDLEFWLEREGISFKETRGSSGMQYNIKVCPACGDRKDKVYLNAESGLGNCFSGSCEQKFNKLKFIHLHLGLGWRETFLHCEEVLKEQGWRPRRTVTAAVTHEDVKFPVSFPLPTSEGNNMIYLENRQVDGALANFFHLRFCTEGWWNFTNREGKKSGQKFDMRIIIPVFDLDGKLVTFQGRDITGKSDKRYLFPAGLPGTGRFLLNGQNAVKAKRVCVGEGAFDIMAIKRALDEEVTLRDVVPIGTFGKHLSYGSMDGNDQLGRFLQLKHDGLQEVTLMWDGTTDAITAALDAARHLKRLGLQIKIAKLPFEKDPNEVLPEVVRDAFWKAELYTSELDVRWRLRNPYVLAKKIKS